MQGIECNKPQMTHQTGRKQMDCSRETFIRTKFKIYVTMIVKSELSGFSLNCSKIEFENISSTIFTSCSCNINFFLK